MMIDGILNNPNQNECSTEYHTISISIFTLDSFGEIWTHWNKLKNDLVIVGCKINKITILETKMFLFKFSLHLRIKLRTNHTTTVIMNVTNGRIADRKTLKMAVDGVKTCKFWFLTNQSKDINGSDVDPIRSIGRNISDNVVGNLMLNDKTTDITWR